ncbi:P-loop NTPase fold protein [Streptomyces antarcticus]|uniref:P-loop NTPase fold protein n=1 Tax=Streptomyces antarcticus TaxID=2996458 RepID=UPI00226EED9D|nr:MULTISPECIES: P-loop NTPase fold protein [unclassified Streptomyces]MCY0946698.1 P-loop NTPase fold protein [Streptomyces sp. H34-AA3]MCZ4085140.1 P-loop NTPase fold protein [Streptomyces sp. H34-S5]
MTQPRPWIIEDSAIVSQEQDRFDHRSVARELSAIVRGSRDPLAIGLLGSFGSGKSSVVRLLDAELKGSRDWAVVHLSAERHSGTARARGLLYGLLDDARRQKLINEKTYASERACLEGGRQRALPRSSPTAGEPGTAWWSYPAAAAVALGWITALLVLIWILGVALVAVGHAVSRGAGVSAWAWFASPGASPLTTVLFGAAVVAGVLGSAKDGALSTLKKYEITLTTPRPDSSDDLEQVFSRLIDRIDRRLVIAIDDIDRLAASDVLEALTTVRSLLLTGTHHQNPPVFLLSCDEDIVREAIVGVRPGLAHRPAPSGEQVGNGAQGKAAEHKATEEAAQEYLNKLFTVRLVLPAHHDADLRQYAERLLTHPTPHDVIGHLGGMPTVHNVLDALIHHGVRDPRHAIRLLNSFLADYALAIRREQPADADTPRIAPGEVTGHPLTLARLMVLRHDFRHLYDEIRVEHDLLALLDDALLGSAAALKDPLLNPFTVSNLPSTDGQNGSDSNDAPRRLNTADHPGLDYLRATAARTRTHRPQHLMPLLTLGSAPASRALGSETAAAIQRELTQRDTDAFTDRLADPASRERVLHAAADTIGAARHGQDLDNALTAAVQALGKTPDLGDQRDEDAATARALQALTDRIARRRTEATIVVPAHNLIAILDLIPPAYLPNLYDALSSPPAPGPAGTPGAEDPAFTWAQALLALPAGPHALHLHPALRGHFDVLANTGTAEELATWLVDWDEASNASRATWPPHAYRALLGMATRAADTETTKRVRRTVELAGDMHQWQRPVVQGLLTWLTATDHGLRSQAISLLSHVGIPSDGWGEPEPIPAMADGSTLATQLAEVAAAFLVDDEDSESSKRTADLLHSWLPTIGDRTASTPGRQVSAVVADAIGLTAHTCTELATAASRILPDLQSQDAATCATAIAGNLSNPGDLEEALRNALGEVLVTYLRLAQNTNAPAVQTASEACLTALTSSLAAPDAHGTFARRCLPAVMTTEQGRVAAPLLADRLMPMLARPNHPDNEGILTSLHVLFRDPDTRASRLAAALQHLQGWINSQPNVAAAFVAHYAADPAVNTQWLAWIAQFWPSIPGPVRTLASAASNRGDLSQTALPAVLAQHLLESDDPGAWEHGAHLWDKLGHDQQAALLAAADGRCPQLTTRSNEASAELLDSALATSTVEQLPSLLDLISSSPQATDALCLYVERAVQAREWDEPRATRVTSACTDPQPLWEVLLKAAGADQSTLQRVSTLIATMIGNAPASIPDSFVDDVGAALLTATPENASALGHAVKPMPALARQLSRTLSGQSKTIAEKARTRAFKTAAGIR